MPRGSISLAVLSLAACLPLAVLAKLGESPRERRLSQPRITFYEPGSDIRQHSYIDLDQQEMEMHLAATPPNWAAARNIYQLGAHSGARAELDFSASFASELPEGRRVTQAGNPAAVGSVKTTAAAGATYLVVSYQSTCQQGGTSTPNVTGCFTLSGGNILVDGTSIGTPTNLANRYRTLSGFSTQAGSKMFQQPVYTQYRAYYGSDDYGDQMVLDALNRVGTCSTCDDAARKEFAKKTSAYMNVWMYVIHEMEDAIVDCQTGCLQCNADPVHAWDEALAFYSGSLEGRDGNADGKLMYRLAEKRCENFRTCGEIQSDVNAAIIPQFIRGKTAILRGDCIDAIPYKQRIVELMSIPLVQGALRYAYKVAELNGGSKERAEGAVFAAAILPRIRTCDAAVAELIRANMIYTATTPMSSGFAMVKVAFESVYDCLGITCEDVGGLILTGNDYHPGAEPCVSASSSLQQSSDSNSTGIVIALIIVAIIASMMCLAAIACAVRARKYQQLLGETSGVKSPAHPGPTAYGNSVNVKPAAEAEQ
jgi:hypothetical protein